MHNECESGAMRVSSVDLMDVLDADEKSELIQAKEDKLCGTEYFVENGCLYRRTADGKTYLLGGWLELKREVLKDNGQDAERFIKTIYHHAGGRAYPFELPLKDLKIERLRELCGIDFRPAVGATKAQYIIDSILAQAPFAQRQTIYQQTGWRKVNGVWTFLHNGGAIGMQGITVELQGRCQQYEFPDTLSAERYDTLALYLQAAPAHITHTLLSLAFLSPLCEAFRRAGYEPSFSVWLNGVTGTRKSTLAALTLNFFGEKWNNKTLPASFKDTPNYLEKMGFLLADCLVCVDDYFPATNRSDSVRMASTAQAIARAWGDRVGRNRMNADTSLKRGYPARGMLLCTGEDSPAVGQSGAARNFTIELKAGDVNLQVLSDVQRNTAHLAQIMREYIQWLAPQYDTLPETLSDRFLILRNEAQGAHHGRTTEAAAHLQTAFECFTRFMVERGQYTQAYADEANANTWRMLGDIVAEQSRRISQDKPTTMFLDALKELLETKTYTLAPLHGGQEICFPNTLGYKDGEYIYLLPDTTYSAVRQFYSKADRVFPLSKNQLYRQLNTEGYICASSTQSTKQKKINGKNGWYLWLRADALTIKGEDI